LIGGSGLNRFAPLASPSLARLPRFGKRARRLALLAAGAGGFLTYLALGVPVKAQLPSHGLLWFCPLNAPPLARSVAVRHAGFAPIALAIVLAVDAAVVAAVLRRRRGAQALCPARPARRLLGIGRPIGFQRVPRRVLVATAAASAILATAGMLEGAALWIVALLILGPWVPAVYVEGAWKYEHYGVYALFVGIVVLQVGHMGEHTMQVSQLMVTHGTLARSHGVFGQLDFETVHFFWDSAIWLSLCFLLFRFARGNPWLWVAFAAASLHEVEHLYLYWLYQFHQSFYLHGGFEGIMGNGGVIGSPLARPYLHFAYNLIVVTPMVLALWDETRRLVASPSPPVQSTMVPA